MAENHIARLTQERDEAQAQVREIFGMLEDLEVYLTGPKFRGPDADYVHVSTDALPKISRIRLAAVAG